LLTSCRFGYDSAFIGTTIARASFKKDFGVTGAEANISSNITSAFQAGAFFGALFCFFSMFAFMLCTVAPGQLLISLSVTERVGRKWALQCSCIIFLIGAILMTVATNQLSYICKWL
jgi:MFS family permease